MRYVDGEQTALHRTQRLLYQSSAIGAVVYVPLLYPAISRQQGMVNSTYFMASVVVTLVIPFSFIVMRLFVPIPALKAIVSVNAIAFTALHLSWQYAQNAESIASGGDVPWMNGIQALHALMVAVAWRPRVAWVYTFVEAVVVVLARYGALENANLKDAILEGVGALVFSMILVGLALTLKSAGHTQDLAAAEARTQVALDATQVTHEREQARINGIIHDDILSVLIAASRPGKNPDLVSNAKLALAKIDQLADAATTTVPYDPEESLVVFRSTVTHLASHIEFTSTMERTKDVPSDVAGAMTEALTEALRNSLIHASERGREVDRHVAVYLDDAGVSITVSDNGRGYDASGVSLRRLGTRVSIMERMNTLPGGSARILSAPGEGTTVTLAWRDQ